MENKTAEQLNQKCEHQQCNHPTLIKETAYGGPTGNYICTQCGYLISPGMKRQPQNQINQYHARKHHDYPLRLPAFTG